MTRGEKEKLEEVYRELMGKEPKKEMFNKTKFLIIPIFLALLFLANLAYAGNPPFRKDIGYHSSTWLFNKEIVFIKRVDHKKSNYGLNPFTNFIKGFANFPEYTTVRTDYYISSMKTDGTDERIIRQFATIGKRFEEKLKPVIVEDGKDIPIEKEICPYTVDCFSKEGLIVFDSSVSLKNADIYIMKTDGFGLKKIAKKARCPRFSSDGTKILYNSGKDGFWIMNADGSNKHKIIDGNVWAIWHSDGKRILFNYIGTKDHYLYMINIDGTGKKRFIKGGVRLSDWSPDGSRFIIGPSMYTSEGKEIWNPFLASRFKNPKKYSIPYNGRFSPDGTKIVGEPGQGWPKGLGNIVILSSDFATIKVLRKNETINIYWRGKR
ncbi:MAG: PD40 domain-containing protein [Candidatus Omnitrophica bacterium]|nr:PD40 domain-containing protein [Candidatus Omnitrophota bacterium]